MSEQASDKSYKQARRRSFEMDFFKVFFHIYHLFLGMLYSLVVTSPALQVDHISLFSCTSNHIFGTQLV